MDACTVETGLLRKKPCGSAAVAKCASCEQPLCIQHAVAQLNPLGRKTGTFLCKECIAAHHEHDKAVAAGARHDQAKKAAETAKSAVAGMGAPPPARKPTAPAASSKDAAEKPAESKDPGAIEFTPAGGTPTGKIEYTPRKTDDKDHKPE